MLTAFLLAAEVSTDRRVPGRARRPRHLFPNGRARAPARDRSRSSSSPRPASELPLAVLDVFATCETARRAERR